MRKVLLILLLIPCFLSSQIKFLDITFDEAQKKARLEGKSIFIDVYRSQPEKFASELKKITKEVLSDKALVKYLEENFVLVGVDMSKQENSYFGPYLYSLMYPCVAFYTDQGVQLEYSNWHKLKEDKELLRKLADKSLADAKVKKENSRKIEFKELSFEDALVVAKKENKMVFIDAYTDWCRPCKLMDLHVFSLDRVADYYNNNFICLKIDFGKERPDLATKYNVKGYPTFLFVNSNGDVVHSASAYKEAEPFIAEGAAALKKFDGIDFYKGTWAETLAKAKTENKLIFLDCFTVWCGPCKQMAATTFKDPLVAEYFNENFVNAKVDMEKGEGIGLRSQYEIKAYPTLLFIDGYGNVEHRIVGSMKADELMREANRIKDGKSLAAMSTLYNSGGATPDFIKEYITVLGKAGDSRNAELVVGSYLKTMDKSKLYEPEYWELFEKYIADVNSDLFQYVFSNKDKFVALIGEKRVNRKINGVWTIGAFTFAKRESEDEFTADPKGLEAYIQRMKKEKVEGWEQIAYMGRLNMAEITSNWKDYTSLISNKLKKEPESINDMTLYNYGIRVNQKCKEQKYRLIVAKWMDDRVGTDVKAKQEELPEGTVAAISLVQGSRFKESMSKISQELKQPFKEK